MTSPGIFRRSPALADLCGGMQLRAMVRGERCDGVQGSSAWWDDLGRRLLHAAFPASSSTTARLRLVSSWRARKGRWSDGLWAKFTVATFLVLSKRH